MERFDFSYPPYDSLCPHERATLQSAVNIAFFDDNEIIIQPQQPIEHLYVVIKGLIKEIGSDGEVVALYNERDTFEARALVEGSSPHQFIVEEQALVYTIPKDTVDEIVQSNSQFGAYFYASVAEKFSSLSGHKKEHEFASLLTAKVRNAYRGDTTWIDGSISLLKTAELMKERRTKTALVRHEGRVGLMTESAFRDIIISGVASSEPVYQWTQFDLISVDIDDFVFDALLRMMQFKIQRVIVEEGGNPIGAMEQLDILAYLSNHSNLVAQRLERAETLEDLAAIAAQMTESVQVLSDNGVRAPQLARLMQVLNGSLFEKAWRMIAPAELYEQSCLIVMGSEGRGEQILKTDQDNALIFREGVDPTVAERAAKQFSATLSQFGYPPCRGNIMVSNPEWRKNLPEFKKMVRNWCISPSPTSMMNLAIFIDAQTVAGDPSLLAEVKEFLTRNLDNDVGMLMMFARAVEQFDSQSQGFFSQLLNRGASQKMDIKKMGIFPVVHGMRALALEAHISETNTFDRIHKLVELNRIEEQLGRDVAEALSYLMNLRLKAGLSAIALNNVDTEEPNQLDLQGLSTLERDLLKDALQVVKRFKGVIRFHFHLNS